MAMRRPENYATLLRVRKRQEDEQALKFAKAQREVHNAQTQRQENEALQRVVIERAAVPAAERKGVKRVDGFLQFQRHLARLAVEKDSEIIGLKQSAGERRSIFEEATQKRRMIERLMERAQRDQAEFLRKNEQKISDETASTQATVRRARERRGR